VSRNHIQIDDCSHVLKDSRSPDCHGPPVPRPAIPIIPRPLHARTSALSH
jgi:hypothetical protein